MLETIKQDSSPNNKGRYLSIAYMGTKSSGAILTELPNEFNIFQNRSLEELKDFLDKQSILTLPDVIILEADTNGECFKFIEKLKKNVLWREIIIILISTSHNKEWKAKALQLKVHDFYILPFPIEHLSERLAFLVKFKLIKPTLTILGKADIGYSLPLEKRLFDIVISSLGLIMVLPILTITAIVIRLDTKGPILYKCKRVGTGYKIFDFYKFRSFRMNADTQLENISDLNFNQSELGNESSTSKSVYLKLIDDDSKVTRFGNFIRRTSIDVLPQLLNVIKGDMSLVGNRPLPLYEAEMLTSNEWALRFMSPAGVTGLWQLKSKGKREISERERKKFDNFYASKYSFWFDIEILIKTITVILHK